MENINFFGNFINEKLGIREDVIVLSDFLYDYLKNNNNENIVIDKKYLPEVSFNIKKIVIEYKEYHYVASFDEKRSKFTKDGFIIYLIFNKNIKPNKQTIYHEISHLIEHEIKISKRIMDYSDKISTYKISNIVNSKKFNNLCDLIYYSDEGEIKSITHEFYSLLLDKCKDIKEYYPKNDIFNYMIDNSDIKILYNKMINYNIYDDLKDIPEKDKIKFFSDIINWNKKIIKIKKSRKNKFYVIYKIISYMFKKHESSINIDDFMGKTQRYINNQGTKLRDRIHRLYDYI